MAVAELIENCACHPFAEGYGSILVALRDDGPSIRLIIEDAGAFTGGDKSMTEERPLKRYTTLVGAMDMLVEKRLALLDRAKWKDTNDTRPHTFDGQ